jgi:hypothetical protein
MESRDMQLTEGITQEPSVDFLGVVNDMQTARGFITNAQADPDQVYQILSDYDSCPRVFRSVARSETVETPEGGKQVLQVGTAPVAVTFTAALHGPVCTSPCDLASRLHCLLHRAPSYPKGPGMIKVHAVYAPSHFTV